MALPILFANMREAYPRRTSEQTPPSSPRASWVGLLAFFAVALCLTWLGTPRSIDGRERGMVGSGIAPEFQMGSLMQFLDDEGIRGNVFNDMALGGALIYSRWPRERVFIDGRTPVYGDRFFADYIAAFRNARQFESLDRTYHFDHLIFLTHHAWNLRPMHEYLAQHPNWRLVFFSPMALVYVRNLPKYADLIARRAIADHPILQEMERQKEEGLEKPFQN